MTKQVEPNESRGLRPSQLMRARRPELFSDSRTSMDPQISREVFEYHLETLTNRKQEVEFEHFCRKLAQKELCPNLLPQTGPTGGGDSKVDTETYPVADGLSLTWYEGIGRAAAQERWAFAFSAKKDWRQKVRADIQSIASTKRGYVHAYFVSNQFIRDKDRAGVEDELSKRFGLQVHILDRSWITDIVYRNKRLALAIETLGLSGYEEKFHANLGPNDRERESQLQQTDADIANTERYKNLPYQLAEDCLQSALLARGLERPRDEVDRRFARAERVACELGYRPQLLRIAYNRAWTSFWWYDDFPELNRLYDEVEKYAVGTTLASETELLLNLWQLLRAAVDRGALDASAAKINQRTTTLKAELTRLANLTERPTTALHGKSNLLILNLREALQADDKPRLDATLVELKELLIAADPMLNFPALSLADLIEELGTIIVDNAAYDDLFESVVAIVERRTSAGEAGQRLLDRGIQKLDGGKRYDAIRFFGRAQGKLALREFQAEHIIALVGCSIAYERAGLLWAARANTLAATNQALQSFFEGRAVDARALRCVQRLVWLELKLGRIPYVLAWMELAGTIAVALNLEGEQLKAFQQQRETQDAVFGILLLKVDAPNLAAIDKLATAVSSLGLVQARMALLYALGYEDRLRSEGWIPENENEAKVRDFFWKWRNQPANVDLPKIPELLYGPEVTLRSVVLGCEVVVQTAANLTSLQLGETLLGQLESFLSTSLGSRTAPYRSKLVVQIRPSEAADKLPHVQMANPGEPAHIRIDHPATISHGNIEDRRALDDRMIEVMVQTMVQMVVLDDTPGSLERLMRDESVFGRMLNYTDLTNCVRNILGAEPKLFLVDWLSDGETERYPVRRSLRWDHGLEPDVPKEPKKDRRPLRPGIGEPPEGVFNIDDMQHRDQRVESLIDIPMWNKAGWHVAVFLASPETGIPPVLALGFKDETTAKAIFSTWRKQLGKVDSEEKIRIAFVTGVDRQFPADYTVIVGGNLDASLRAAGPGARVLMISRLCRMHPSNTDNLDRFLQAFERERAFYLAPAHVPDPKASPTVFHDLAIGKRELVVRKAWQIPENDPDISAIANGDEPVIPDGVKDAPVFRALARRRR